MPNCVIPGCVQPRHSYYDMFCRSHMGFSFRCVCGNYFDIRGESRPIFSNVYFCSQHCLDRYYPLCHCGGRHSDECPFPKLPSLYKECYLPNRVFSVELETDIAVKTPLGWEDITDGSINGREYLSGPILGQDGIDHIEAGCDFLNQNHSTIVTRSCGFHLHMNARDLSEDMVARYVELAYAHQDEIFNMMPSSRRESDWCKPLRERFARITSLYEACYDKKKQGEEKFQASSKHSFGRYVWVNLASYYYRGTIEIRLHSGTTNSEKVLRWTEFMLKLLEYGANGGKAEENVWKTMEAAGVRPSTIEFYQHRVEQFSNYNLLEVC